MSRLKKLYHRFFPKYEYIRRIKVSYPIGNALLERNHEFTPEEDRWVIDTEKEDYNTETGKVYLCKRKKITK